MEFTETRSFVAFDFDSLLTKLFCSLREQSECSPRNMKVKELLAPRLELCDPRCRVITSKSREANYGFSVGEFLWYWRASDDLETMQYYNKRMKNFSNDGLTLNSAYGYRLKDVPLRYYPKHPHRTEMNSQWENCINELVADKDTRRAVMFIDSPKDHFDRDSKDVPCTLTLQFLLRDGFLNLHVNMRSNDAVWGLTHDLFSFTLLQECMMLELKERGVDCELGCYVHTAGSMHIYERHYGMMDSFISENMRSGTYVDDLVANRTMEPINSLQSLEELLKDEEKLRLKMIDAIDESKYIGACKFMAHELNLHRVKRDNEGAKNV